MDYDTPANHILYQVHDEEDNYMYIGSSGLQISILEYNHRNWQHKGYDSTDFREALIAKGDNWTFSILYKGFCTKRKLEELEGIAIREANTKYNRDLYPLESSIKYGRCPASPP